MKGVIVTLTLFVILFGMNGCYTIPKHISEETEQIIYYEQPIIVIENPYYPPYDPCPLPTPPTDPNPPRKTRPVEQPENRDGSSYKVRDDLRNNNGRGNDNDRGDGTRNSSTERNRNGR